MSIAHLDSLPPIQFISILENFQECNITEKVDGYKLSIHKDMSGELYTSNGRDHFYSIDDIPIQSSTNAIRSASSAILTSWGVKEFLDCGEYINLEILYGDMPNAIFYGVNAIVLLSTNSNKKFNDLQPLVHDTKTRTEKVMSVNGKTVEIITQMSNWQFMLPTNLHIDLNLPDDFTNYKDWVDENIDTLNLDLRSVKPAEKQERKNDRIILRKLAVDKQKNIISSILTNIDLRSMTSNYSIKPHKGVEGGVITYNRITTKLVDRQFFTYTNRFNHTISNYIKKDSHGAPHSAFTTIPPIYDNMYIRFAEILHIPDMANHSTLKRKFKHYSTESINCLCDHATMSHDWGFIQRLIFECIDDTLSKLENYRILVIEQEFHVVHIHGRNSYTLPQEMQERIMVRFAEMRQLISSMRLQVARSRNINEIFSKIYSAYLPK